MICFIAEDSLYYTASEIDILKESYKLDEVISLPRVSEIKELIKDVGKAIMIPSSPSKLDPLFADNSLLTIVRLPNKRGIRTEEEYLLGISEEQALTEKLGISITKPKGGFEDMASAENLKKITEELMNKLKMLIGVKGLFLIGMPGTGKSFYAKKFAGHFDYYLVEMNLSLIMQRDDPIESLNHLFSFFEKSERKFLVWIDEIEKMISKQNFKSIQVLGVLLTRLNELSMDKFSDGSIISIATANNIKELSETTPELFRKGRFDDIVFLDVPTEKEAKDILKLHLDLKMKHIKSVLIPYQFFGLYANKFSIKKEYMDDVNYMEIVQDFRDDFELIFFNETHYFYQIANLEKAEEHDAVISDALRNGLDSKTVDELKTFSKELAIGGFNSKSKKQEFVFNKYCEYIKNDNGNKIKECYSKYEEVFGFPEKEIHGVVNSIIKFYRGKITVGTGRGDKFPYVHSEIELLASHLLLEKKAQLEMHGNTYCADVDWKQATSNIVEGLIPLQIVMREPLQYIVGMSDKFTKG